MTAEAIKRNLTETEATEERTYTLRKLEAKDVSYMTSIMSKIGIREFKNCFGKDEIRAMTGVFTSDEGSIEAIGVSICIDVAGIVLENYKKAEQDIYGLLASLSGMTEETIASLPMSTFFEMILDVAQKEEFKDFMKVVSKLFK